MLSALTVFELAGSHSGGKLVGENLAGGTDPGGIVGGPVETAEMTCVTNGNDGKFGHVTDKCCGVRDPPLDSAFASRLSGQDKEEKTVDVESKKVSSAAGEKVGSSEPKTWSSLFSKKPTGKSSFLPVTSKTS